MGVIKNLMVRIGADARDYNRGMKGAASTTSTVSQTVNKHTSSMKKSISNCFASAGTAIKEHAAAVARTKEDYAVATQNAERLNDKVQQLRSVYDTVKNATRGIDLSKPLSEQMVDAEKALTQIEAKRRKIEAELQSLSNSPRGGSSKRTAALQAELNSLSEKSRFAIARLKNLDRVAEAVGSSNIGYASAAGLQQLEGQIRSTENELNTTKIRTEELGAKLKSLGVLPTIGRAIKNIGAAAAHAAGNGVSKLWQTLKRLGASAAQGIASLPGKLRNIGNSASASCGGLGKMVRSIRNIGVASLGMRVASSIFGRLRSIISSYISENEELNASVTSLKNQMGEALLPAINLVLAAMQKLMPVVTSVSNGINSILTSLFGNMLKTTSAIKQAADEANSLEIYGFDQITKASESSSSSSSSASSSGGSQSALVQKLTGWIQKLKGAFVAGDWKRLGQIVGDGINSMFDYINAIDVGAKFGTFVNNLMTTAYGVLSTVDFTEIGASLGQMFTSAIQKVDWDQAGTTIGLALLALPSILVGFALNTDWGYLGQSISDLLKSALDTGTQWIQSTDWIQLGKNISDLIAGVDWSGLASSLFSFFGAALGAGVSTLWGAIGDAVTSIKTYFSQKIEDAGGDVGKGLLQGIKDGIGNIGTWITDNVITPFVDGFKGLNNGVVDVIEGMVNTVIAGINRLFSGLNSFLALGDKVGLNLSIPTINEVTLPRAARGTVVNKATNLTVGEDGTEAVVPLEKHTGWMDYLASKLSVKASGNGGGTQSVTFQFILGNRVVTEYFIKDINQITHENGVCPIKI